MKVAIDSDATGEPLKRALVEHLRGYKFDVDDNPSKRSAAFPYPDIAKMTARRVAAGEYDRAILICGTGLGMAMMANKTKGVFAGTCSEPEQAARLASHNNAQVLCLGAEVLSVLRAKKIARAFLSTPFTDRPNARRMRALENAE